MTDTPGTKKRRAGDGGLKKRLRNPYFVSFRSQITSKKRIIWCSQLDVMDRWYAVGFKGTAKRAQWFTEWLDRREWELMTPIERQRHYIKKETARVEKVKAHLERKARMRRTPEEIEARRQKQLEKKREYMKKYMAKKRAEKVVAAEPPEATKPRILLDETPAAPKAPESPDVLTPAEEKALSDGAPRSVATAGDIRKEMPNEYNARYHVENERYPFGHPDKLAVFDALVTSNVTMQEAKVRIQQAKVKRALAEMIEKTGAGWTSG